MLSAEFINVKSYRTLTEEDLLRKSSQSGNQIAMDHIHESHAIGSPPSNSPGYLPQYLLGGNSPAISPLPKGRHIGSFKEGPAGQAGVLSSPRTNPFHVNSPLRPQGLLGKADKTVPRASPLSCTPKDPIGAPPVEALYDARSSAIMNNSAFGREQVRCAYFSSQFSKFSIV